MAIHAYSCPYPEGCTCGLGMDYSTHAKKKADDPSEAAAGSQIAAADLREWVRQLREKFALPVAKGKMDAEWWAGYEEALKDLEAFISRQSEKRIVLRVGAEHSPEASIRLLAPIRSNALLSTTR